MNIRTQLPDQSGLQTAEGPPRQKHWLFRPRVPDDVVAGIRRDREAGMPVLEVAAKWGVSGAHVSRIHNGLARRSSGGAKSAS
jgi:hypothetical protein